MWSLRDSPIMNTSSRGCVKTSLQRPSCALPDTRRPDEGIARIDQPLGIVAAVEELAQRIEADRPADQEALRDVAPHHRKERKRRLRFDPFGGHLHLARVRQHDRPHAHQRITAASYKWPRRGTTTCRTRSTRRSPGHYKKNT